MKWEIDQIQSVDAPKANNNKWGKKKEKKKKDKHFETFRLC